MIHPNQRSDVIVSYIFLRDLMHAQASSFTSKTSKAIQRRLKYILKNLQTRVNVDVFVGEALQDVTLCERFKPGGGVVYSRAMPAEQLEAAFTEIYACLRGRFRYVSHICSHQQMFVVRIMDSLRCNGKSTNPLLATVLVISRSTIRWQSLSSVCFSNADFAPHALELPRTGAELRALYDVRSHQQRPVVRWRHVTTKEDICFWVLHNIIHVSLSPFATAHLL